MKTLTRSYSLLAVALGLLLGAGAAHSKTINVKTETTPLRVVTVTDGLKNPWGLDFLPGGKMIVTERGGQMRVVEADGTKGPALKGLPDIIARGQGGLLDVTVAPDFATSKRVYFAYSEPAKEGKGNSTAVAYGILKGDTLEDVTVVFSQQPKFDSTAHFGSRIVFTPDGNMFVTLGDRYSRMDDAQTLDNHHGKVVRIKPDGSVPEDNPFVKTEGALPEIWSYGHRNVQGAALHPTTGKLWTGEHGPQGGDEINLDEPGKNYGWPVITYGENYGGGKIGIGTHKDGMEQPLHKWVPSIAIAGMTFYTGDKFPEWKGNLLVSALRGQTLARLVLDGDNITHEERLLQKEVGERFRDVVQGPDGFVYLVSDESNGKIYRLEPAGKK
ncbi:PQQ-dependent sugar dehydrogenase [Cellvibrio sp. ARAG 10.3]|uniref:PQQ-dependent sugar dehydrogenase n=1 Tax=Cellvibrio sp. ARAG 10.3 TaxID=3451358 RepID=UPI003F477D41